MIWNHFVSVSYLKTASMTELNLPEHFASPIRRRRKVQLKIDMTPMVDLGFLLISFFIFTTEISRPAATKLYMPHDGGPIGVPASKSLTILIKNHNELFYYYGDCEKAFSTNQIVRTSYNEMTGLGNIIRQKQQELETRKVNKKELIILIKPGKECSYKDLVYVLDEMLINNVAKYAVTDLQQDELTFLNGSK
jgi:biopolymer transport protein ExbD